MGEGLCEIALTADIFRSCYFVYMHARYYRCMGYGVYYSLVLQGARASDGATVVGKLLY